MKPALSWREIDSENNLMRKKMVLIEKLQSQLQEERAKHRFQQIKSATDTIDEEEILIKK